MTNSVIRLLQKNIKRYRKEKGYTQLQLAVFSKLSKDYIVAIEVGRRIPSLNSLIGISEALEVDIRDLFTP